MQPCARVQECASGFWRLRSRPHRHPHCGAFKQIQAAQAIGCLKGRLVWHYVVALDRPSAPLIIQFLLAICYVQKA